MSQARDAGIEALRSGDAKAALQHLAQAVKENPQDVQAIAYLGTAYGQLNMPEQAAQCLARAVALAPQSAPIRFNLGAALERAGKPEQARACYQEALKLDSSHQRAAQALARLGGAPGASPAAPPTPAAGPAMAGDFLLPGAEPSPAPGPAPSPYGPPPPAAGSQYGTPPPASPYGAPPPASGGAPAPAPGYPMASPMAPPPAAPGYVSPGGPAAPGAYPAPPPPPAPSGPPGGMQPLGEWTPPPQAAPAGGPPGGMQPLGEWTPPPGSQGGLAGYQTAPPRTSEYGPPPAPVTRVAGDTFVGAARADEGVSRKDFLGQCYLAGMGMGVWWGLAGGVGVFLRSMSMPGSMWSRALPIILAICAMQVALGALLYGLIGLLGGNSEDAEGTCSNAGMALGVLTAIAGIMGGMTFTFYGAAIGGFAGFWVSRMLGKALGGNINEMQANVFVVAGAHGVATARQR